MYDLCTRIQDMKIASRFAGRLGFRGIGIIAPLKDFEKIITQMKKSRGFEVFPGIELEVKNPRDLRKLARGMRKRAELIAVRGGNLEINREALSIPEVDVLLSPWSGRRDPGINHILAKLGKDNNTAVGFEFRELLYSYGNRRAGVFSSMLRAAKLVKKYKTPFVITSGALSEWDLRSPSELISFGRLLGFQDREIKKALSDSIPKENRKRLSKKWIMPGVELE